MAGSVSSRQRQKADLRRYGCAGHGQLAAISREFWSRPSAVARDGPVLGCASRSRSRTSE